MGCSPSRWSEDPQWLPSRKRERTPHSPLTVAGTAADLHRIPVTLARFCFRRSPPRAQYPRSCGLKAASLRARVRACGAARRYNARTRGRGQTLGAKRRKAERPPEPLRGKPSSADALRPALEGENKESENKKPTSETQKAFPAGGRPFAFHWWSRGGSNP